MSIDKFGHHVHKRMRISVDGYGSNLPLKVFKSPEASDDAVNKMYVDKITESLVTKQDLSAEVRNIKKELDSLLLKIRQKYYLKSEIRHLLNLAPSQENNNE